ncbi:MAG: hypothetical protein KAJ67_04640 [Gemmatimonadetes bacterium]|nr:hypothetical protein [Gemmatimonadota bacterium]
MTQPPTIRIALVGVLLAAAPGAGVAQVVQRVAAPSTVQRSAAEGRRLAEQNFALRQALRALERVNPEPSRVTLYITQKRDDELWRVYFGSLDFARRQFRVAYVAAQVAPGSEEFAVTTYPEDVPANEFVSRAAMALITALNAFEPPRIKFFPHVFQESDGRWVTYFLPEMVPPGRMPQQVDSRIVVSPDTRRVLESTRFYAEISFTVEYDGPAAARMRTRRDLASLERFLAYYVPRAAAQPSVAPLVFLLAYYSCSITPPQLAPGCWR